MKFTTKPIQHYPPHLRHVATLPWKIKNSIFCRYSAAKFLEISKIDKVTESLKKGVNFFETQCRTVRKKQDLQTASNVMYDNSKVLRCFTELLLMTVLPSLRYPQLQLDIPLTEVPPGCCWILPLTEKPPATAGYSLHWDTPGYSWIFPSLRYPLATSGYFPSLRYPWLLLDTSPHWDTPGYS